MFKSNPPRTTDPKIETKKYSLRSILINRSRRGTNKIGDRIIELSVFTDFEPCQVLSAYVSGYCSWVLFRRPDYLSNTPALHRLPGIMGQDVWFLLLLSVSIVQVCGLFVFFGGNTPTEVQRLRFLLMASNVYAAGVWAFIATLIGVASIENWGVGIFFGFCAGNLWAVARIGLNIAVDREVARLRANRREAQHLELAQARTT